MIKHYFILLLGLMVLLSSSCNSEEKNEADFNSLRTELRQTFPNADTCMTVSPALPTNGLLYVVIVGDTTQIVYQEKPGKIKCFDYKKAAETNYDIVVCKDDKVREEWSKFIQSELNLKDTSQNIVSVQEEIGAVPNYNNVIVNSKVRFADKVLSLVYNSIVGDSLGHVRISIADKKLNYYRYTDFPNAKVDLKAFDNFVTSTKKDKDKDMWSQMEESNCIKEISCPQFVYCNYRKDQLIINGKPYPKHEYASNYTRVLNCKDTIFYWEDSLLKQYEPQNDVLGIAVKKAELQNIKMQKKGVGDWFVVTVLIIFFGIVALFLVFQLLRKNKGNKKKVGSINDNSSDHTPNGPSNENSQLMPDTNVGTQSASSNVQPIESVPTSSNGQQVQSSINWASKLSAKSTIDDILKAFDKQFSTRKADEHKKVVNSSENYDKFLKDIDGIYRDKTTSVIEATKKVLKICEKFAKDLKIKDCNFVSDYQNKLKIVKDYEDNKANFDLFLLVAQSTKQRQLVEALDNLRIKYPKLPQLKSGSDEYDSIMAKNSGNVIVAIKSFLAECADKVSRDTFDTLVDSNIDYLKTKKLVKNSEDVLLSDKLESLRDVYTTSSQKAGDAYAFVSNFVDPNHTEAQKNNSKIYSQLEAMLESFKESLGKDLKIGKQLTFWKSLDLASVFFEKCLSTLSSSCDIELNVEPSKLLSAMKSAYTDALVVKTMEQKLRSTSVVEPKSVAKDVNERLSNYNKTMNDCANLEISMSADILRKMEELIANSNKAEALNTWMPKMWEHFVRDFVITRPQNQDQLISMALNIAYHSADFVYCWHENKRLEFCKNYQYLLANFDSSLTQEFKYNVPSKSSGQADLAYSLVPEQERQKMKILVDGYDISSDM